MSPAASTAVRLNITANQCTSRPRTSRMHDEHGLGGEVGAGGGDDAVAERRVRCAAPTPRSRRRARSRATAPRLSQTASVLSSRLSAAQRAAIENGTANTRATSPPARIASQSQRHCAAGRPRRRPERGVEAELARVEDAVRIEGRLDRGEHAAGRAERLADEAGPVEPDAVVVGEVAAVGEHGPLAGVPQRDVRRLDLLGRRRGGEREVEAGAVRVAVRQVAARDAGVRHGEQRGAARRRTARRAGTTARRSPSCRRRSPCASGPAGRACRCGARASRRRGPPTPAFAAAHASATTAIVASTIAGSPSSSTSSTLCVPSPPWLRATRPRRRGAARPASRRAGAPCRQASMPSANDGERVGRPSLRRPAPGGPAARPA